VIGRTFVLTEREVKVLEMITAARGPWVAEDIARRADVTNIHRLLRSLKREGLARVVGHRSVGGAQLWAAYECEPCGEPCGSFYDDGIALGHRSCVGPRAAFRRGIPEVPAR
jgi:hypothetical protein